MAAADLRTGGGIEESLIVADIVEDSRRRIDTRFDEYPRRFARFRLDCEERGFDPGIALLNNADQFQGRQLWAGTIGFRQMGIEQVIEFVIPGNYGACDPGHEQETGDDQPDPAMQER